MLLHPCFPACLLGIVLAESLDFNHCSKGAGLCFVCFNVLMSIFERARENRGGAEREGTQNLKQAPDSVLSAQSLMQGLNS